MRVLGVDPGTLRMGFGVVEETAQGVRCLEWGVLSASPKLPLHQRLHELHQGLLAVAERWHPDELAVEEPFVSPGRGARTALAVGQAQGVALLVAAERGLDMHTYPPARVKQAVADFGAGTKAQVQEAVRLLLGLESVPEPPDAADALAVALCHLQYRAAARLVSAGGDIL